MFFLRLQNSYVLSVSLHRRVSFPSLTMPVSRNIIQNCRQHKSLSVEQKVSSKPGVVQFRKRRLVELHAQLTRFR